MSVYVAVFGTLTWRQQSNFGTFGFDMGIYDQGIWLLSRFKTPFDTVRGLNYFGHHVNLITLLLVPFYWLGSGPHLLYLVETVCMAAGSVPLYLLGGELLGSRWTAAALASAYLLYPSLEWINWWHFHPDALIIAPLLWAYLFARQGRWRPFAVAVVVALACKEDAALAVIVLGLLVAWWGRRRTGLITAAGAAAWFAVCTKVVIPHANGGIGPLYEELFPGLGTTVTSIIFNAVRHPSRLVTPLTEHHRITYYTMLLAPVAFVPLLALPVLLIGGPQTVVNAVSAHTYTYDIKYHYSSIVTAVVFLATVEACARWGRRPGLQRFLVGTVVATSLAANVAWSPSPLGVKYHSGIWAQPQARHLVVNQALRQVPAGAGVSTTYYLVPHLTHRVAVYEFPNPWVQANWGIKGERAPLTASVDWLVLDRTLVGDQAGLLGRLVRPGGEFAAQFDKDGILVARRVRPPAAAKGPPG